MCQPHLAWDRLHRSGAPRSCQHHLRGLLPQRLGQSCSPSPGSEPHFLAQVPPAPRCTSPHAHVHWLLCPAAQQNPATAEPTLREEAEVAYSLLGDLVEIAYSTMHCEWPWTESGL